MMYTKGYAWFWLVVLVFIGVLELYGWIKDRKPGARVLPLLLVVGAFMTGCSHRDSQWGKLVDGGPADQPQSSITVQHRQGYVELFFRGNTPPSDSFWYADELFAGHALTVYAQVGPNMFKVTPDKFQIDNAGTRVTFDGWKTLYPDCSSVQIAY